MVAESSFYKLMFFYHVYVILHRFFYPMVAEKDSVFGGEWKYLTHWNAMIQIAYYICSGFIAMQQQLNESTSKIKGYVFSCLVFPLAVFVVTVFWGLYHINPDLVIDPNVQFHETTWTNHMKHTFVLFAVAAEVAIVEHVYPPKLLGSLIAFSVAGAYMVWVHVIYFIDSFWVYPILAHLELFSRLLFCFSIIGLYQAYHLIGRALNAKLHGGKIKFIKFESSIV